ncbi:unnamed protein product [Mucor hiemalis]
MSLQTAPPEVLNQVFMMLPKTTIEQCLFVCRSCYFAAIEIYYSNITLTANNIEKFISTHLTYYQHSSGTPAWVRHLRFDFKEYPVLPSQLDFTTLITDFKNLKSIDLQSLSENSVIRCLENMRLTAGNLKYLEEIRVNENMSTEGRETHFKTVYAYRNTISCLYMNYFHTFYNMEEEKAGNYMNFLPQFKNLTHLFLSNDSMTGDHCMTMYLVLDMCPKLIDFKLQSPRYFADGSRPKMLFLMNQDILEAKKLQVSVKKRNINLKCMRFSIRVLEDFHMREKDIVILFAKYLSSVKTVEIAAFSPGGSRLSRRGLMRERHRLQQLQGQQQGGEIITSGEDMIQNHWDFVKNVVGTRKFHCHMCLYIGEEYLDFQDFRMKIDNDGFLELAYGLAPESPHNNLTLFLTQSPLDINSVEIRDAQYYPLKDCLEAIEIALTECPNLTYFYMNRGGSHYRLEAIPYPYNIEFDNPKVISGESIKYLKEYQRYHSTKQKKLNHISINNAELTPTLIQLLCTYLPQTKVLILRNCDIQESENNTTVINLKSIRHLHYLELEIVMLVAQPPSQKVFITIVMSNNTTLYYQSESESFIPVAFKHLDKVKSDTSFIVILCNVIDELRVVAPIGHATSTLRLKK